MNSEVSTVPIIGHELDPTGRNAYPIVSVVKYFMNSAKTGRTPPPSHHQNTCCSFIYTCSRSRSLMENDWSDFKLFFGRVFGKHNLTLYWIIGRNESISSCKNIELQGSFIYEHEQSFLIRKGDSLWKLPAFTSTYRGEKPFPLPSGAASR